MGSFNDEYLKLRKKRLEEEENGKTREIITPYRRPLRSDIAPVEITRGKADGDIAPTSEGFSGTGRRFGSLIQNEVEGNYSHIPSTVDFSLTSNLAQKDEEERTWFKKSEADNFWEGLGASAADVAHNILTGGLNIIEGAIDAGASVLPVFTDSTNKLAAGLGGFYNDITGKGLTKEEIEGLTAFPQTAIEMASKSFIKKDLIDEENLASSIMAATGPAIEMLSAPFRGDVPTLKNVLGSVNDAVDKTIKNKEYIDNEMEPDSVFGEKSDALVQSGGQLAATAALQAAGVPWWLTTGVTSYGGEVENALNSGATMEEAQLSGMISAGAEILTEKISGGISFGGKTLDAGMTSLLASNISNKAVRTLAKLGIDAAGEGGEEILSGVMSAIGQKLTYESEEKLFGEDGLFSSEEAFEAFIGGAVLGGGSSSVSAVQSAVNKTDAVTGLKADSEQKVVDKLFKEALADAEADGTKLTPKEKTNIYNGILNNLEKGYIPMDTITEVLGGKEYGAFKQALADEEALQKEYDELYHMKNADKSNAQIDREAELKVKLEEGKSSNLVSNLKQSLDNKVFAIAKDTMLAESYNEQARRGQAFEADLTQYDTKQAEIVKKAIDSGILNNTNRTHEFVDMVSKISADKGVSFDFANNAKLKESGFAMNGKTINGFVTKDGVTLNIDSAKSLNSVVGHEITHVLEGTELYTELSKVITEYAKSKGDYQGRYDAITELYKGVKDANVDSELVADLVGDYLFTDADFVNNLSVQHRNVFQKIFDEIKYLAKVATAGSKEARELEKVKKAFEKAYKGESKASGDTKYSLTMVEAVKPTSDKWSPSATTDEVRAAHPTLYAVDETATEKRNPTQVKGTVGSYRNIYESLKAEGFNGTILDASSGLGLGTKVGIEEYGFKVDDIEPYPDSSYKPKYTDYSALDKSYDVVISNAVLNVLPQDQRDALVIKMGESLNPGGKMFVNVRGKDVLNASGKIAINADNMEYFIPRTEKTGSYQKGFTKAELKAYLEDALGEGYTVKPTNILNGVSVVVTKDGGVKYSLSDSDGKQLSKEQSDYFKDSKMRDDNGNLKVMYHGSQNAGFHIFDPSMSDDGISLFFVDRNDVAASYSGTSETYEAHTMRDVEDVKNFISTIVTNGEGYDVVEKDGKFTLYYKGDRVAESDTAHGIYEEFCWYEGVGEGDANYKVYLNLTNPLEIDAKGKNWNNISREYSQEVADRYNSLTAEEKAALTDLAEWGEYGIFKDEMLDARAAAEQGVSSGFGDVAFTKTLARAYEKLGGANANLYDAFSIASENFSDEAIKQFAAKQMNTRDYAQRAKEGGYDGVIIKNVHDNGGYSNGSEGASTVAIAFNSEQVKSVANEKPTSDPDIRYSLGYSENSEKPLYKYTKKQYNDFGWARDINAISKNEVDDMHSKILVKGSLKKFDQSYYGEAIIQVNDDPKAKLGVNNVLAFVTGTKNNPEITRVARINVYDEDTVDIIRKDIYENSSHRALKAYADRMGEELLQYYDRSNHADYSAYEDKFRTQRSGSESEGNTPVNRDGDQRSGTLEETKSNEIAPIKEASSNDGVFFDGENPKFSLSEYTAEEKKAHNDAVVNHFGKTYSWAETGYLLLDGTRLDLSGKHDGAPGGYRTVDHRDITEALGYDYGGGDYSGSLVQFMSEGNIRIIPECNGINLSVKPTKAQEQALSNYISRYRGEVMLDIDDLNGNTVVSVEYPYGTYSTKVLNDIREWFDNGKKPENAGNYSLTKEGDTPKRYGTYNVYGKDIGLAPMQNIAPVDNTVDNADNSVDEAVAPTVDNTVDNTYPDEFAPMENAYTVEQEIERITDEMKAIYEQYNDLRAEGKYAEAEALTQRFIELNERASDLNTRADELKAQETEETRGYLDSLTDADAPPEMEAPYYTGDSIIDPFENRSRKEVGSQKVKAFMDVNPEVKPYFQAEANILLGELDSSHKAQSVYTGDAFYDMPYDFTKDIPLVYRTARLTTSDIAYLLDGGMNAGGYTYAEIREGIEAIINDAPKKNACAKRIEFILHDRLMNGYDSYGVDVPPNQEYRDLIKEKGVLEGREEAFRQLIKGANKNMPAEDIAPLPTYDSSSKAQIPGQQTIFEDATIEEAPIKETPTKEAPTEEPKIAKVLTEEPKADNKRRGVWSMIKNNILDKGMVFEDLSLKTGNRELQAKWNSIRYANSRAQQLIGKGDGNVKSLNSIRDKVEKSGKTQEFYDYLYHLHNVDRMSLEGKAASTIEALKEKFGHLKPEQIQAIALTEITDKTTERTANTIHEAGRYLQALDSKNKPVFADEVTADMSRQTAAELEKANPEFKQWAQDVYDYANNLREMLVEEGVISRETADLWAEIYPHYVPIRRAGKDGPAINVALDTNRTGINAPIKRATGGNSDILPLFDTMALRTEQTYRAIAKNRFGVELKNTLGTTIDRGNMSLDDAIDNLDNDEGLLKEGKNGANPTFTVFENGERVEFEITEEMYDAIKPTGKGLSYTNKVANTVGNVFRGLLTEYNPVFMATNAVKDAQDVLINSQHAGKTYLNIPVAIKEMATKGHWYKEYIANGGEQNTYFDSDSKTFEATDKGIKKIVGMPLRAISAVNNTIERLPRLAEYIASRKSGASVDVSMLDAARVTTNFAAGGDLTKALNRNGFTFLNASTQGAIQQVRNVREAKANGLKGWLQLATKTAIAGIPALILNNLLWDDDEEYEELSDYIKQDYYIVAKTEDGKFVRIPKGRAVAVIQNAFEQISNGLTGDDEVDMQSFFELAISNLAPNNPLENNVIAPIIQVAENKTWYGEDLVPSRLQDLPAAEQFDESTDSISKWLGEKLDYSPYKINYLLNQYSGGIGDVALPMLTPESDGSGVLAPFTDKFTTDSVMKNQNVTDFYDTADELTKNANSAKATDEDILKDKYMNTVRAELGELYAQKREIQNSDLSDEEKNELVREIQEQINAKAKESLDTYGKVNIDNGYATVGDLHYRWKVPSEDSEQEPHWEKITDEQLEKQEKVTRGLGITPSEYWGKKAEYDFAYESPGKYAVAKSVGGYDAYKSYSSALYDIKADKDENGKSISGSRKDKVATWLNGLDAEYGEKIILFKSEYPADDTYNYDIIEYLNSRDDISYKEMESILIELGFTVDSEGNIYWD